MSLSLLAKFRAKLQKPSRRLGPRQGTYTFPSALGETPPSAFRPFLGHFPTACRRAPRLFYKMSLKKIAGLLQTAFKDWTRDEAPRLGAALSYYTIFAIPPLFVIVVFIASLCFDRQAVQTELFSQVGGFIGKKGAEAIQSALNTTNPHGKGLVASGIAIVTLVLTATGLFIELQAALNRVWGVEVKPGQGIWGFIKNRLLSFAVVVSIGFLLLVSLVVSAVLAAAGKYFSDRMPGLDILWSVLNALVSFGVITALFALMFKVLPDVIIALRDVWVGAITTSLLFTAGKSLLGLYLGSNSSVTAYGAAGSVVLILLWVYYSAQILLYGAEVTQAYANTYGAHLVPKSHAQWIQGCVQSPKAKGPAASATPAPQRAPGRKAALVFELREEVEALRAHVRSIQNRASSHARKT